MNAIRWTITNPRNPRDKVTVPAPDRRDESAQRQLKEFIREHKF